MDSNRLIGKAGKLPWHIPEDLAWFKEVTLGHPVLMGKNTWLSLPFPLPGRQNVVLSRDPLFEAKEALILHSITEAVSFSNDRPVFVIGGAQVFAQFLPLADKLYITKIEAEFIGDTWFPLYKESDWMLNWSKACITTNQINYSFNIYNRINSLA